MLFNFDSMLDEFGVPLEIKLNNGNGNGHYEAGEWVADNGTSTKKVNEPLVPATIQATNTQESSGQVSLYDANWYSHEHDIPMNAGVIDVRTGKEYKVVDATDYNGYSNVTVYGLKKVDADE
mgnify:CR=1 FL=1